MNRLLLSIVSLVIVSRFIIAADREMYGLATVQDTFVSNKQEADKAAQYGASFNCGFSQYKDTAACLTANNPPTTNVRYTYAMMEVQVFSQPPEKLRMILEIRGAPTLTIGRTVALFKDPKKGTIFVRDDDVRLFQVNVIRRELVNAPR